MSLTITAHIKHCNYHSLVNELIHSSLIRSILGDEKNIRKLLFNTSHGVILKPAIKTLANHKLKNLSVKCENFLFEDQEQMQMLSISISVIDYSIILRLISQTLGKKLGNKNALLATTIEAIDSVINDDTKEKLICTVINNINADGYKVLEEVTNSSLNIDLQLHSLNCTLSN